ncbi:hypothetical protein [Deinococcus sp.]|uniref:hypothetical protein n=1 Tax=Deinococcus sp. TaxID=47478 RepID=UPI003C7B764D
MRPFSLLPLLGLLTLAPSIHAQSSDASDAQARKLLFQSCGAVESQALPSGVQPGVYRGTLGAQPITLELRSKPGESGGQIQDRYRYDRHGVSIVLERGRPAGQTATPALLGIESVFHGDGSSARGCLKLTADGGALRGQWFTPDGTKRLAVALTTVEVAAVPLALSASPELTKLRSGDPFTFLALNRAWSKVAGGLKEPLTGVTYPRVPGGSPALNLALQDGQIKLVRDALDCLGGDTNVENGTDFSAAGTLSWKSAGLVSLHENVEYYCGGAHPDSYTAGLTLDARSGKTVRLAGKPGTLWPGLSAQKVQALYVAGYPKNADVSGCVDEVASPEISGEYDNYTLYLDAKGLTLWPTYLPHVAMACAEAVTVPYARLRALADPKSPYFHDLYPR